MIGTGRNAARARAVGLVLAGITAGSLLGGPAVAHVGKRVGHLQTHLDPVYLNEAQKANDSNLLDGLDSTQFLRSNAKAADADLLDGVSSAGFLAAGGKAVDADKLDNIDSTAFVLGATSLSRQFSCPGTSFFPLNSLNEWAFDAEGLRWLTTSGFVRCAVTLPNSATVTAVSYTVYDNSANAVVCNLYRTDLTAPVGSEDTVQTANASSGAAATPGETVITAPGITSANATINNASFAYSLDCALDGTVNNGVFGGVITYSVTAANG
jgi:hypothetical protein